MSVFLYCGGHHDSDRTAVLVWSPRLKLLYCKYHQFMYTLPNKDFLPSFLPSAQAQLYDLVTFYKIRANCINIRFPETVRKSPHQADRCLHIQSLHSDAYRYHFFTRTVRMWNLIPVQAITTDSVNTFRPTG